MAKRGRKNKEEEVMDRAKDELADGITGSSVKKDKRLKRETKEPDEPKPTPTPSEKTPRPRKSGKQAEASARKLPARPHVQTKFSGTKVFGWTSEKEIMALVELAKVASADDNHNKKGFNWEQLATAVGRRLECPVTKTQIYEKARRLKEKYIANNKKINAGEFGSFKTPDDEKLYKLSQRVWGTGEGLTLHLEEDEHYTLAGNLEKLSDAEGNHKPDTLHDPAMDTSELNVQREVSSSPKQQDAPRDQREPTMDPGLAADVVKGCMQKTFNLFHAECEAFLKDLQKSCKVVLDSMQVKFLSMVKEVGGSHSMWARSGSSTRVISPLEFIQASSSWDTAVDSFLSGDGPAGTDGLAAFQNLREQWQQHRLQELKLTSLKLQLMLDECKLEQEKLEKQAFKSTPSS